jgi:hypothetical protein
MYSITIYSDDNTLGGNVEYSVSYGWTSYIARIWDVRHRREDGTGATLIESKSFGNGTQAEDWMLDKLMCPLFTLLAK